MRLLILRKLPQTLVVNTYKFAVVWMDCEKIVEIRIIS
jgi:hypothetical protein